MATHAPETKIRKVVDTLTEVLSKIVEIRDEIEGDDEEDSPIYAALEKAITYIESSRDALAASVAEGSE